ncbi:21864_t:CDS:10 [Cetraspora pellucida]|uniref:21864_t:CDS:1 n=1 Tax=Cetraspora pellucida TaxID=1433469 RepID=A0A9N9A0U3_9GLOM|nr:21864_t:CDS:10 [Cetraspora pellucida]
MSIVYHTALRQDTEVKNQTGKITDLTDSDAQKTVRNMHKCLMAATDKRVGVLDELLQIIRTVKIYAMEDYFRSKVVAARDIELRELNNYMFIRMSIRMSWEILTFLMMLFSFFMYSKILGKELTSSLAFTAIILFKNLLHVLNETPAIIISITQALVSISRIEEFLKESEIYTKILENNGVILNSNNCIGFEDATLQWTNKGSNQFALNNLNIHFLPGKLSLIFGPSGCGKTCLLKALLALDVKCSDGHVFKPRLGNIAYVAQTVWLQNGTIRDNILFGQDYEPERYFKVIAMCKLEDDLKVFISKDKTEIGENGIVLSNGQKQRVALARAIYSKHEVLIIDDFLSAVDLHITKSIYKQILTNELTNNRTIILVTHNKDFLHDADMTIYLKDGRVDKIEYSIKNLSEHENVERIAKETCKNIAGSQDGNRLITEEIQAEGMVNWWIYTIYMIKSKMVLLLISIFILATWYIQTKQDFLIKSWVDAHKTHNKVNQAVSHIEVLSPLTESFNLIARNFVLTQTLFLPMSYEFDNVDYYFWAYALVTLVAISLKSFKTYFIFFGSLIASKELHNSMLEKILNTTIRFYDTTPTGRILNRFSKDMEIIDQILSLNVTSFIYSLMSAGALVISAILNIDIDIRFKFLIAGIFVVVSILYAIIGISYISTSRYLKRLESVTRSPIYSAFDNTISGISTIRTFGVEERLKEKMWDLIDINNQPCLLNWACNQWLHTHTNVVGGLFSLAVGFIIIFNLSKGMEPGLAGLILTCVLSFSRNIVDAITTYSVMEMNMNSVERVHEYLSLEVEQRIIDGLSPLLNEWPHSGDIQVKNLGVQYSNNDPSVIKNISFHVCPGEKIGIIGRTGSGKSTLARSFIRLNINHGQIIIDGIDISKVDVFALRLNIILSSFISDNLCYGKNVKTNKIYDALRKAHLIENDSLLTPNTIVNVGGNNFSQSQRQQIALARAILYKSKVVIMDELTADDGNIVEFDDPYTLLQNPNSELRKICIESGKFETFYV